jgi:hypothetical protein
MDSILDQPSRYIINEDRTPKIILVAVTILIISIVLIIIVYLSISSPVTNLGSLVEKCNIGECATNIFTGEKRCSNVNPDEGNLVLYAAEYEVCNREFSCNNSLTPYALRSNGSVDINGLCEKNTQCRCLQNPQCPAFIMTTFNTNNGDPFMALDGQRISFYQNNRYKNAQGNPSQNLPLGYVNPATTFCTIPIDWLNRTVPGCNFVGEMTPDAVRICMNTGTPCLQGNLAYIPLDVNKFTEANQINTPVGCTIGNKCSNINEIAIYDVSSGMNICKSF